MTTIADQPILRNFSRSALSWFAVSIRDIRMPRIEELNDLMPAPRFSRPGVDESMADEANVYASKWPAN